MGGQITFTVEYDPATKQVRIVPPVAPTCENLPEYSAAGQARKNLFRTQLIRGLELWDLEGEDPCVRVGGKLWCW